MREAEYRSGNAAVEILLGESFSAEEPSARNQAAAFLKNCSTAAEQQFVLDRITKRAEELGIHYTKLLPALRFVIATLPIEIISTHALQIHSELVGANIYDRGLLDLTAENSSEGAKLEARKNLLLAALAEASQRISLVGIDRCPQSPINYTPGVYLLLRALNPSPQQLKSGKRSELVAKALLSANAEEVDFVIKRRMSFKLAKDPVDLAPASLQEIAQLIPASSLLYRLSLAERILDKLHEKQAHSERTLLADVEHDRVMRNRLVNSCMPDHRRAAAREWARERESISGYYLKLLEIVIATIPITDERRAPYADCLAAQVTHPAFADRALNAQAFLNITSGQGFLNKDDDAINEAWLLASKCGPDDVRYLNRYYLNLAQAGNLDTDFDALTRAMTLVVRQAQPAEALILAKELRIQLFQPIKEPGPRRIEGRDLLSKVESDQRNLHAERRRKQSSLDYAGQTPHTPSEEFKRWSEHRLGLAKFYITLLGVTSIQTEDLKVREDAATFLSKKLGHRSNPLTSTLLASLGTIVEKLPVDRQLNYEADIRSHYPRDRSPVWERIRNNILKNIGAIPVPRDTLGLRHFLNALKPYLKSERREISTVAFTTLRRVLDGVAENQWAECALQVGLIGVNNDSAFNNYNSYENDSSYAYQSASQIVEFLRDIADRATNSKTQLVFGLELLKVAYCLRKDSLRKTLSLTPLNVELDAIHALAVKASTNELATACLDYCGSSIEVLLRIENQILLDSFDPSPFVRTMLRLTPFVEPARIMPALETLQTSSFLTDEFLASLPTLEAPAINKAMRQALQRLRTHGSLFKLLDQIERRAPFYLISIDRLEPEQLAEVEAHNRAVSELAKEVQIEGLATLVEETVSALPPTVGNNQISLIVKSFHRLQALKAIMPLEGGEPQRSDLTGPALDQLHVSALNYLRSIPPDSTKQSERTSFLMNTATRLALYSNSNGACRETALVISQFLKQNLHSDLLIEGMEALAVLLTRLPETEWIGYAKVIELSTLDYRVYTHAFSCMAQLMRQARDNVVKSELESAITNALVSPKDLNHDLREINLESAWQVITKVLGDGSDSMLHIAAQTSATAVDRLRAKDTFKQAIQVLSALATFGTEEEKLIRARIIAEHFEVELSKSFHTDAAMLKIIGALAQTGKSEIVSIFISRIDERLDTSEARRRSAGNVLQKILVLAPAEELKSYLRMLATLHNNQVLATRSLRYTAARSLGEHVAQYNTEMYKFWEGLLMEDASGGEPKN